MGWEVFPDGLRRCLLRAGRLGKPVYVTENGMATVDDTARTEHLYAHLEKVRGALIKRRGSRQPPGMGRALRLI